MENTPFFQNRTKLLLHMAQAADSPHPFSEAEVPAHLLQEAGLPPRVCHAVCRSTWLGNPICSLARPPMTSEFCLQCLPGAAASGAKEAGDELFIGGEMRTQPPREGAAGRSSPCDCRAQAPLHKIIIIDSSSIYLSLSSYNLPRWELSLYYSI